MSSWMVWVWYTIPNPFVPGPSLRGRDGNGWNSGS